MRRAIAKAITADSGMTWLEAFAVSFFALSLAVPAIAALYLAKSALGIDVLPGHSPLHDLLYQMVR